MKPLIVRRFTLLCDRAGRLRRFCLRGRACGVRGCDNSAQICYLPDGGEEYYCLDHMYDQGFCPGCHLFWAGIESFDFSRTGYCENCASEFDDDDWDDDLPRVDPWEDALSNCYSSDWGRTCGAAGSEDCEFDCLIRRDYYRSLRSGGEHVQT